MALGGVGMEGEGDPSLTEKVVRRWGSGGGGVVWERGHVWRRRVGEGYV